MRPSAAVIGAVRGLRTRGVAGGRPAARAPRRAAAPDAAPARPRLSAGAVIAVVLGVALGGLPGVFGCGEPGDHAVRVDPAGPDGPAAPSACPAAAHPRSALAGAGVVLRASEGDAPSPFGADGTWRTIDGDPRRALPVLASREVVRPGAVPLPAAAPVRWRIPLGAGAFAGVERFVVTPRAGVHGAGLHPLEPVVATARGTAPDRFVEIEVDLSSVPTGRGEARLSATLFAAPIAARASLESGPIDLPSGGAWLEFGFGVLDAGVDRGPVSFRLEACTAAGCRCLHEERLDPARAADRGWQPRALALSPDPSGPVRLRFGAHAAGANGDEPPILLAEWTRPRLLVPRDDAGDPPKSLLLISLDTLRADHLGAYGYERDTSPYLSERLAPAATTFLHAVAPATATGPSHMSMFTGLPPAVHGITSNLAPSGLPEGVETLAEVLRDHGYVTGSINENGALGRRMGFDRGFDHHRQFFGANVMKPTGFVDAVFDEGIAFLERHPGQRFFLFLHTYEVHSPYDPPEAYRALFPEGDDPRHPDNRRVGPARRRVYPVRYDREIRHVDDALARLVPALRAGGWLDDAIVVITSDHGEAFAEHGTYGHGNDVYQESLHVPLLVLGDGVPAGRRVEAPVGLIDLAPTLIEWLGLDAAGRLAGRSFAGLLDADADAASDEDARVIVSESWRHAPEAGTGGVRRTRTHVAVRRGDLKLIRRLRDDGAPEAGWHEALYDLAADPGETRDLLAGDVAAATADLAAAAARLRAVADGLEAAEAVQRAALGPSPPAPTAPDEALDAIPAERLEALRMLGYVE